MRKSDDNREIKSAFQLHGFKQQIKKGTRVTNESSTFN